jgi:uncharacterized protein (TIGR02246 family)
MGHHVALAAAPAAAAPADEIAAVSAAVRQFAEAWNRHDADGLAALYLDDADFVNVIGLWWRGRDEIRREHTMLHEGRMRHTTLAFAEPVVRLLAPGVAVAHVRWELRGDAGAPGWKLGEVRRGILTSVLVGREGGWKIASTQNTDVVDVPNN